MSHFNVSLIVWAEKKKRLALRPQKPLRLIRDGEVGGVRKFLYLTPTRYTVTTRMILH